MRFRLLLWIFALVTGCNFDAHTSVDGTFNFGLGSLDRSCHGSGATDNDYGHTDWSKSSDGVTCHISATWNGNLVDMPAVRQKVEDELKKNGSSLDKSDVSFKQINLTFHDAQLAPSLPVSAIHVNLTVGADTLADKNAANLGALFDGTPVTAPKKTISAAYDAFKKKTPLLASGTKRLRRAAGVAANRAERRQLVAQLTTEVFAQVTVNEL